MELIGPLFIIISFIVFLTLPVGILLLILRLSKKPSRWKYPPTRRITQFLFSLGNVIFSGAIVSQFVLLLFAALSSGWGIIMALSVLVLFVVALVSLWRPAYTYNIFLIYGVLIISSYYSSPDRELATTYRDICNELRNDPLCGESPEGFHCKAPSKREGVYNKTICVNNTSGNSDYNINNTHSKYLGETFITKKPLLYIKNLPRNNCKHRSCGYKYDIELEDLYNNCGNCLDRKRLTTKLRAEFVPAGTSLKVVDAFSTKYKFFSIDGGSHKYLVVEDEKGNKAEISDYRFESDVIKTDLRRGTEIEEKVVRDLEKFTDNSLFIKHYCFWRYSDKNEDANVIESYLHNFIKDFQLNEEMTYLPLTEFLGADKKISYCSVISFRTKNAYLLSHYYFEEWGLYARDIN